MSRVLLVAAAALVTALAAWLWRERQRRTAAEDEARSLARAAEESDRRNREWLAVFGHELRSPLAAVLGYAELLEDGTFGDLDERAAEAVHRLRSSADQLVGLLEGMDARHYGTEDAAPAEVDAGTILREATAAVAVEAEARGVSIVVEGGSTRLLTRADVVGRALRLVLGAAIKVSQGATLRVTAAAAPLPHILIAGTHLDPVRDDPDNAEGSAARALTGAGLRLALARVTAGQLGGALRLENDGATTLVRLEMPHATD